MAREEAKRCQDLDELVAEATVLVERLRPALGTAPKWSWKACLLASRTCWKPEFAAREMFTATLEMAAHVAEHAESEAKMGGTVKGLPGLHQADRRRTRLDQARTRLLAAC